MTVRILEGDCRAVLATLPDNSVHCCVTSPPYFGLRDYGVEGQIGLEATLGAYIEELVSVFREVRRVLRGDGTCWLNLGDSYAGSWGAQGRRETESDDPSWRGSQIRNHPKRASSTGSMKDAGLKPKDLMLVPARVAIALQADGWWVRSDIIWHKPSCMPESCTDRPTTDHEHVFLLAQSERYFYDAVAISEPTASLDAGHPSFRPNSVEIARSGRREFSAKNDSVRSYGASRNARTVWTIATQPYAGAHFATMPSELARRCISAGTSEGGCCATCMTPLVRMIEKGAPDGEAQRAAGGDALGGYGGQSTKGHDDAGVQNASDVKRRVLAGMVEKRTVGWRRTCACAPAGPVQPCVVLDPFGGAGTTGLAADRLRRDAVLIELNPAYADQARRRIGADAPLLGAIA